MAVQLSASYLRRSYQLLSPLMPVGQQREEAFRLAGDLLYHWAKHKFSWIFRQMPSEIASFSDQRDGNEIGLILDPQELCLIFRCVHPDARIAGRQWITDVEIRPEGEALLMAIRLSVSSLHHCKEEVPFSRPSFVGQIIEQVGVRDVIPLQSDPHFLQGREEVDSFLHLLQDPARSLPVVVLSACRDGEQGPYDGYLMNGKQMAADLVGVAHVFCLSREAADALTDRVGRSWSVFNGAVRTYYPGVCFEDESGCYRHPLLSAQRIRLQEEGEETAEDLPMQKIENYLQNHLVVRRVPWEERGIVFYLTAHQNRLQAQRDASTQSRREQIASYEEQLANLRAQCDENLALADSYSQDCDACHEKNEQLLQRNNCLRAQVELLRYQLQKATGRDALSEDFGEERYADIPDWINRCYPDRLFLHPRAARSLKSAVYEDVHLVYQCLKLLATSYYAYRMGQLNREELLRACTEVDPGLDERGAITDTAAGMQGEEYYVQYQGKRRKLERHLAKGSSKDRRHCLRIYYFWDDESQVVVIGDLPHHLDTSAT